MNFLYDVRKTYDENFQHIPSEKLKKSSEFTDDSQTNKTFLGFRLNSLLGIPAGPLLNSQYCEEAFNRGYDVCVYKTVRSRFHECNNFPNVLFAHPKNPKQLSLKEANQGVLADGNMPQSPDEISISNSFGVPSKDPLFWIDDVQKAAEKAKDGQLLILSFQPTGKTTDELVADIKEAAKYANQTGLDVFEINTSCPNEGKDALLCYDVETTVKVLEGAREILGNDAKIIIKTAYFEDTDYLHQFIDKTHNLVNAYSTINTISTHLYDKDGNNALDENRPTSGVCGASIKWAGIDAVQKFDQYRSTNNLDYQIIGVGGVMNKFDFEEYLKAGADLVMTATGAMFIPDLATQIKRDK